MTKRRILICFCLLNFCVGIVFFFKDTPKSADTAHLTPEEVVVFQSNNMKMIVPPCPLGAGSVQLIPKTKIASFSNWSNSQNLETYENLQKIASIWKERGVNDYLVYGKEGQPSQFSWEAVPFPKSGWRFWQQFKVLWKVTFGSTCIPKTNRLITAKNYQKDKELFSESQLRQIKTINTAALAKDPFCDPNVISKQLLFEGREVYVLYNHAPIGEDKLHFLIIPKKHRTRFSDLTDTEYQESMQLSQKLIRFYHTKGYNTAYLFHKTGTRAGQTVPHWHEHLIFTKTQTQDFFGKLTVLKNMLFGSSPLPKEELETRISSLKSELNALCEI